VSKSIHVCGMDVASAVLELWRFSSLKLHGNLAQHFSLRRLYSLQDKQARVNAEFAGQAIAVYEISFDCERASLKEQMDAVVAQRESELRVMVAAVMKEEREAAKRTEKVGATKYCLVSDALVGWGVLMPDIT
jgi:hypothetical protein